MDDILKNVGQVFQQATQVAGHYINQFGSGVQSGVQNVERGMGMNQIQQPIPQSMSMVPQQPNFMQRLNQPITAQGIGNSQPINWGQVGQSVMKTIGNQPLFQNPGIGANINPLPNTTIGNTGVPYVQNRILKPAMTFAQNAGALAPNAAAFPNANPAKAVLSGMQTAFNVGAAPVALAFNAFGGAKGAYLAARQGQNPEQGFQKGFTGQNEPGLGTALTNNKPLAAILNLGEMVAPFAQGKVSQMAMGLKGLSPNAFSIHPEDQKVLGQIIDTFQTEGKLNPNENKMLQTLADHYLGQRYSVGTTKKITDTFDAILSNQNGGVKTQIPGAAYLTNPNTESVVSKMQPLGGEAEQKLLPGSTQPLTVKQATQLFKKTDTAYPFVNQLKPNEQPITIPEGGVTGKQLFNEGSRVPFTKQEQAGKQANRAMFKDLGATKAVTKLITNQKREQAFNDSYNQANQNLFNNTYKAPPVSAPHVADLLENAEVIDGKTSIPGNNILKNLIPNYQSNSADIQNSFRDKRGNYDLSRDQAVRNSEPLIKTWNDQPVDQRLKFMQRIQAGEPQPTPQLQEMAKNYGTRFDQDYQIAKSVNPDLHYKDNYFTKSGIWALQEEAQKFYYQWQQQKLAGTPGSFKELQFPTIYDGLKAGLKLKESNPETLFLNNHIQILKAKMAGDFIAEQKAKGADMTKVQKIVDQYLDSGLSQNGVFRTVKGINSAMNSADLSLSAFHLTGTSINASISKFGLGLNQLLTGHPIQAAGSVVRTPTAALEYVFRGNKILGDAKAGLNTEDIRNIAGGGGTIGNNPQYEGSGLMKAIQNMKDGNVIQGALKAPFGVINDLAKPIMEYWVPRLKAGAAADAIENRLKQLGPSATPEQIQAAKAEVIDSIDNRFGQLNQDNLFWNKSLKDGLGLAMRSPGWNIGTVRELGLGTRDLFDVKRLLSGQGISSRAAYTIALPVMVGLMGATYQYLKTGQGPQSATDLFYPRTGQKDQNGKDERVAFPTYAKDVYAFMHNPVQTVINKQSPIISDTLKQYQNKDYFGNPIYDPNADLPTQLRQRAASEVIGNLPFSLTSAGNRVNPNAETFLESQSGITKAPGSVTGGFYATKDDAYKNLNTNQQNVMNYFTLSSQNGGPTSAQKADALLKNTWAIPLMKQLQTSSNPNDPLWSRSPNDIQDYLAYQASTDSKIKAELRLKDPWITDVQQQSSQLITQAVASAKSKQQQTANSPLTAVKNILGDYQPQPLTPSSYFVQRPETPYVQLTPDQRKVADAYTASPQGSAARQQLLFQNPWLKNYWTQNTAYYQQNPIQKTDPLSNYLTSIGINPNTAAGGGSGGSGGMSSLQAYKLKQNFKRLARQKPRKISAKGFSSKGIKVPRSKETTFKLNKHKPVHFNYA